MQTVTINPSTRVIDLSVEQLLNIIQTATAGQVKQPTRPEKTPRYVHGLHGLETLLGVCHATAQKLKNTVLAPAVLQRGRKILIDADKALELFDQYQKRK